MKVRVKFQSDQGDGYLDLEASDVDDAKSAVKPLLNKIYDYSEITEIYNIEKEPYILLFSSRYKKYGYKSREDYLRSLSDEYGLSIEAVTDLAQLYGPSEDFDGLVTACQDAADALNDFDENTGVIMNWEDYL